MGDRKAYVYQITVDGVVRYVGKGRGDRLNDHRKIAARVLIANQLVKNRLYRNLAKALRDGSEIKASRLRCGLTDKQAFSVEVETIAAAPARQLWNSTTGGNGLSSVSAKALWRVHRASIVAALRSPDCLRANSERALELWADPTYRAKAVQGGRDKWRRLSFRRKMSRQSKSNWDNPDYRSRTTAGMTQTWARPDKKSEMSRLRKAMWEDPAFRARWQEARWGTR